MKSYVVVAIVLLTLSALVDDLSAQLDFCGQLHSKDVIKLKACYQFGLYVCSCTHFEQSACSAQ